jgi:hypothetical protein
MINTSFDGSFTVTNIGAQRNADMLTLGRAFRLAYYQSGAGGHDKVSLLPLVVDPTLTSLPNPTSGKMPLLTGSLSQIDYKETKLSITLDKNVGTGILSSIGIYGEVFSVANPEDASIVGNVFLYAVCNLGYSQKASNAKRTFNFILHSI